jgi:hypothetical protein
MQKYYFLHFCYFIIFGPEMMSKVEKKSLPSNNAFFSSQCAIHEYVIGQNK